MDLPTVNRTTQDLAARDAELSEMLSSHQLEVMRDTVRDLVKRGAAREALTVGETAPDFILPDASGEPVRLYSHLERGPVVLVFYRGGWCPFCETYLRGLQRELFYFRELGAELMAVSPQLPDSSLQTRVAAELAFPVVSDPGLRTSRQYGLAYQVPAKLLAIYQKLGIKLDRLNGDAGADQLPLAATFVINADRHIVRAEINEDYTRRLDPVDIIAELVELRAS